MKIVFLAFLTLLFTGQIYASASISGFVVDNESGETIIRASVAITGTKLGAYTNKSGFFSISNIPDGNYVIAVSSVGFKRIYDTLSLKSNDDISKTYRLLPAAVVGNEVEVTANRNDEKRQITISKVEVPLQQIKNIKIGGESDVFRTLQFLPGVLTSSQLSSSLYIRGGSPDQNLVLLDGSTVYNPSHLFGFISTFNTNAIKDVELIKGGFPAEYGGRLSSVLNITQKDGNQKEIKGKAAIGVISSNAMLEGPLGRGSWFISGRRTYFELIKAFVANDPQNPLPDFSFYDVNAKITQSITDKDKISVSAFASGDHLKYDSYGIGMDLSITNKMITSRWTHVFSPQLFSSMNFSASEYSNDFSGDNAGYEFLINNSITDYTLKESVEWFINESITAKMGFEASYYTFRYLQNFTGNTDSTSSGSKAGMINMVVNDWNHSAFAQVNWNYLDVFSVQVGLRASYWTLSSNFLLDPRIALRWRFDENSAIKFAFGVYHQNLRLSSMPDFSFFDTWLPTDTTVAVSRALHYILSYETTIASDYNFNVDLYYKQLVAINEINVNSLNQQSASTVKDVFYIGNGYSYGIEFFLQKKAGRLSGWIGYSLGWVFAKFDEINNGTEFRPKYDRLHDLKIVTQYQLSDDWDVGATFTFQTGQSYTGASSRFQSMLIDQNYGKGKIVPMQRYGLRLPPSHQLNVFVTYNFKSFGKPSKLTLDIYNIYNRRDVWFRYYDVQNKASVVTDVLLLPIIPTLSYEISF